jgi:CRISPR-associated protein Csd1
LKGNNNSSVCTNCAKTYVEGLNWLLSSGSEVLTAGKRGKAKPQFRYSNRRNFGKDTAMVFWTRDNQTVDEIDLLEAPTAGEVARMIDTLSTGKKQDSRYLETERFYSCTLSGAAARIAVRDWIETSLGDFRMSIAHWFKDISIKRYDFDLKEMITLYAPLYELARSCQRKNSDDSYDKEDTATARVASSLWKAALQNRPMPLWILTKVLQRARLDKHGVTPERAALIKVILNRNNKGGDFMVMENKADGNRPVAYICGQIFAKLESIQYAALGDRNAGIREKYFTYAMTTPAAAFGRLFNLHSKHFTKLKGEKPGLAVTLDKELQELCKDVDINSFPQLFQLEEQGQFAIGYYHQKQAQFAGKTLKGEDQ